MSSLSHYNFTNVKLDNEGNICRVHTEKDENGKDIEVYKNSQGKIVNTNELNPIDDDMDLIIDCIRQTVNDFQWVIFGYAPPKLKDLIEKRKIEIHNSSTIMNYPSRFDNLNLQAVVAPIQDIEFNRCKSFIKYMESAALGVPLYASNALPYNRIMPERQLFNDGNDLKEKLLKLKFSSMGAYESIIENQWKWLNSPCHEGDFDIKNFWMEDNKDIWIDLMQLRDKTVPGFVSIYRRKKMERDAQIIYSDNNGVEIRK